jgi:putative endonuclease
MKPIGTHNYYVYITTNPQKTVIYTGVTNDLARRMAEHFLDSINQKKTFAGKYNCYKLIYYEHFEYIIQAIAREKEIKGWSKSKKVDLVKSENKEWKFLNNEIE